MHFRPTPHKKVPLRGEISMFEGEKTRILLEKFSGLNHSLHIPYQRKRKIINKNFRITHTVTREQRI